MFEFFAMLRIIVTIVLAASVTCGQAAETRTLDLESINYGFAAYLGSGIYTASDQSVQVYQVPLSYTFFDIAQKGWAITAKLPVTFGFYNFKILDLPESGLPEDVSTFSMLPGVEFQFQATPRWQLAPFVDYGFAMNLSNDDSNIVYGYGVRSRYEVPNDNFIFTLGNNLLYSRQYGSSYDQASKFGYFETGLDFRFPAFRLFKIHQADFSAYYANFRYFDKLEFLRPKERAQEVIIQNEVGVTFGVTLLEKYRYLDIPRVGLGYRWGDDLSVIRLVFGMPF